MAKQVVDPGQEDLIEQQTSAVGPGLTSITQEEALAQQAYREAHPELYAYVPIDSGGGFEFGSILGAVLAVASLAIPGIGEVVGAAILEAVGITGVTPAVATAVGSSALSAATTAASGGSVEDVLKSAASAGAAAGLNISLGGDVTGAVAGSVAGSAIKGGTEQQILTNAIAAGVGAGVQGVLTDNSDAGKIIGTAARTYIATGGDVDKTLLNTAASAIGTLDQPDKSAQQLQAASTPASDAAAQETAAKEVETVTQSDAARQQELADYQEKLNQYAIDKAIYEQTYGPIADQPPAAAPETAPATETALAPQTIAATTSAVAPVVTDLDLVKKVAAQPTPAVDPKELEKIIVQGQGANVANVAPVSTEITTPRPDTTAGLPTPEADQQTLQKVIVQGQGANVANVAPVEINVSSDTVPSSKTVITPTTEDPFPKSTIEAEKEKEEEAAVVTDLPTTRPDTTAGLTGGDTDLGRVDIGYVTDPFVDIAPPSGDETTDLGTQYINYPVDPFVDIAPPSESDGGTTLDTVKVNYPVDPFVDIAPPPELEKVTVTAKSELPPEAPTIASDAPEVKAEEPKKEEPKKEEPKKLYPTVTSVPPPKRPRAPPIITGASPARLLADALAAYRPAGSIEGVDSGKERQNVWNEKSLRLKDALGL